MTIYTSRRGGSWSGGPRYCRSAFRYRVGPGSTYNYLGFRVVCLPQEVTPPQMLLRGGSWNYDPWNCRSAYRNRLQPGNANYDFGFRVVCLPQEVALHRMPLPHRILLRGGSWGDLPGHCRSAYRGRTELDNAVSFIGFRVVCLPPPPE